MLDSPPSDSSSPPTTSRSKLGLTAGEQVATSQTTTLTLIYNTWPITDLRGYWQQITTELAMDLFYCFRNHLVNVSRYPRVLHRQVVHHYITTLSRTNKVKVATVLLWRNCSWTFHVTKLHDILLLAVWNELVLCRTEVYALHTAIKRLCRLLYDMLLLLNPR